MCLGSKLWPTFPAISEVVYDHLESGSVSVNKYLVVDFVKLMYSGEHLLENRSLHRAKDLFGRSYCFSAANINLNNVTLQKFVGLNTRQFVIFIVFSLNLEVPKLLFELLVETFALLHDFSVSH